MKKDLIYLSVIVLLFSLLIGSVAVNADFVGGFSRLDLDGNGSVDISDVTYLLNYLANGCEHDAVNDTGYPVTCTEAGLTDGSHCEKCGEILSAQEVIPAPGHNYVNGVCRTCGRIECTPGLLFAEAEDGCAVIGYNGESLEIYVPDTYNGLPVTEIGEYAFMYYRDITKVDLPQSVTRIGKEAFCYCNNLRTVNIPSGVTEICKDAFYECYELQGIKLPENLTSIGDYAFYDCHLIDVELPAGVTSIGEYAFYGCLGIDRIAIPGGIEELSEGCFDYCENLQTVILPEGLRTIGDYAFTDCGFKAIRLPDGLQTIGKGAFYDCDDLESIVIPDGVTVIQDGAFKDCSCLRSVTLPANLVTIGKDAFNDCRSLMSVEIPQKVESIGADAFRYCYVLAEVINHSDLTLVCGSEENGGVAYYAKAVHSGESLITNRDGFVFLSADGGNYLLGYDGNDADIVLPSNFDGQPYEILAYAFYDHDLLRSVVIPEGITDIPESAFDGCGAIESVDLPSTLLSIGKNAFRDNNFTSITIPESVESIGDYAFGFCEKLFEVINHSDLPIVLGDDSYGRVALYALVVHTGESRIAREGDYFFLTGDGTYYLVGYAGSGTDLVLPTNYNGGSYEIAQYVFNFNKDLTSVKITAGVTAIGYMAFADCPHLTAVTIRGGVQRIADFAFENNYQLAEVTLPSSLRTVGNGAFLNDDSIQTVRFTGSAAAWSAITFGTFNQCLTGINVIYYA